MDFHIDPNASLADIQLACFMAAITALVELAKTTDKDHIKLRALTEVARLCAPTVRPPLPRGSASGRGRERATGLAPSSTPSIPSSAPASSPTPHASAPVARARGSEGSEFFTPSSPSRSSSSTSLNRRQRRLLARIEATERERELKPQVAA